jgi:hypothetical protein
MQAIVDSLTAPFAGKTEAICAGRDLDLDLDSFTTLRSAEAEECGYLPTRTADPDALKSDRSRVPVAPFSAGTCHEKELGKSFIIKMELFLSLMAHSAAGRAERLTLSLTRHPAGYPG